MTPQDKLSDLIDVYQYHYPLKKQSNVDWLISRVIQLENALKLLENGEMHTSDIKHTLSTNPSDVV